MRQGNLSHTLLPSATELPSTELIILAGDPDIRSAYPAENAAILKEKYPHVKFGRRLGASHDMHKDKPDVVAAVILGGLAGDKEIEVLAG
jgi:pimeloyl-ACP methyl ester carboxylesterase